MTRGRLLLCGLATLLASLIAGVAWILFSSSGASWVIGHLPGVQVEGGNGALLSDFTARRLVIRLPTRDVIEIDDLRWTQSRFEVFHRTWVMGGLSARQVNVQVAPVTGPLPVPADLHLPIGFRIPALDIQTLLIDGRKGLGPVQATLELGRNQHRLQLRADRDAHLHLEGELRVATQAPLQSHLELQLVGQGEQAWTGQIEAHGALASPAVQFKLSAAGQSLQGTASLAPFASWPVRALELKTEALNLAALHRAWPRTALSGRAELRPEGEQLRWQLQLRNTAPGRWDQQALPVLGLDLDLRGRPEHLSQWRVEALEARLPAGARVQGQADLQADGGWRLDARIDGLRPEWLDQRLVPARLEGQLQLAGGRGQPLAIATHLSGTLVGSDPLQLRARLQQAGPAWQLKQLELTAGHAHAEMHGELWPAAQRQSSQLEARFNDVDPGLIWKGPLPRMRLSGQAQARMQGGAASLSAALSRSELVGLPLQADIRLERDQAAAPWRHEADMTLGGSHWRSRGEWQQGALNGHLQFESRQLAELTPLIQHLDPSLRPRGSMSLDTRLQWRSEAGRWQVMAEGQGRGRDLGWSPAWTLGTVQGQWALPRPGSHDPLRLELDLKDLLHAQGHLRNARIRLDGDGQDQVGQISLEGQWPPGRGDGMPVAAQLAFTGTWREPAWQGRVKQLRVDGGTPGQTPWLEATDLALDVDALRWQLAPGRAHIGGVPVRWQKAQGGWQADAPFDLDLELEPLAVAPLLARWQPDFGWGGDLQLIGHMRLHRASRMEADLLLARQSGDLTVTDEFGPQRLGLSELRLAASCQDGVWRLAQGLAGSNLGTFVALQVLRPTGPWPDAQTPLDGLLQAQVDNLSAWGGWVPAGWRLGGRLSAQARLGGRLGAPEWQGQASGQALALRHPLYGVDLHDGQFTLALDGLQARLTDWRARAGDGEVRARGEARLGAEPQALLQMDAERLQILGRADRRLVVSGQTELQLSAAALHLRGNLKADQGLIDFSRADAPSLADDVIVQRGPSAAAPAKATAQRTTRVDLGLDFGKDFRVLGRGLKTELRGALKLAQNDGPLRVTGKLQAQGGDYAAYGQKLEIERGDLNFNGPYDNPVLDLLATRPNTDTRVGVRVTGTALAPRVALFSDPDLPETDKLSWLLLGRGPDGLGRTDTALLQRAALALLSGEGESVTGRALRGIGLDELSLAQSDDDARSTIVRLGKQLSRRWYVGYERSLNATTGSWQLIYRIAQRFTLRAQSGDDNALDLIWQWRWD